MIMVSFCFYPHPTSLNHGCEAIAVSTANILRKWVPDAKATLLTKYERSSEQLGGDLAYDLYDRIEHLSMKMVTRWSKTWFLYQMTKLIGNDSPTRLIEKKLTKKHRAVFEENDIFVSIGGDNYCYGRPFSLYAMNSVAHFFGKKTILWGCSIEPADITQEMLDDLSRYDVIVARESITYNALKSRGLDNLELYPDPAFTLEPAESTEILHNTVGINISPLILRCVANSNAVLSAYKNIVGYILENTDYNIALIPHVTIPGNNDIETLKELGSEFEGNRRIRLFGDMDCRQLKALIGQCRLFVGARTHATIAAYSMCVPTLVCGYSVKAKGIAADLFGAYQNYVLPVQEIKSEHDLTNAFIWLLENQDSIRRHLGKIMPGYIESAQEAGRVFLDVSK
jgi:polysaccharide pyruvyl transferase WcaK-like protein